MNSDKILGKNKSLYIAKSGDETLLLVHREIDNEIRFLFNEPSEAILAEVAAHFKPAPVLIAANELLIEQNLAEGSHSSEYIWNSEVIMNIESVATMQDSRNRRHYHVCLRRHPELVVERYDHVLHRELARDFLEEWSQVRNEDQNKVANIHNDNRFLDLYGDGSKDNVQGIIIRDKNKNDKIVALGFFFTGLDNQPVATICKCLRGYAQLGVFTFIERAKEMAKTGAKFAYIGSINNDFKRRFMQNGIDQKVACKELRRDEGYEVNRRQLVTFFR